jgi:hypothetical protein
MATPADKLMEKLRNEPTSLAWELRKKLGDKTGVLIFMDQLEELVTLADQREVETLGAALGRHLLSHARHSHARHRTQ